MIRSFEYLECTTDNINDKAAAGAQRWQLYCRKKFPLNLRIAPGGEQDLLFRVERTDAVHCFKAVISI